MPIVTIEYDLDEEKNEYDQHFYSTYMYLALCDISALLRNIEKGFEPGHEEMYNEKLFEKIREHLEESKVWEIL